MAARRLVILMLFLLALSTLAAALVPSPSVRRGAETTATAPRTATETAPPEPSTRQTGRLVRRSISADEEPVTVSVAAGDQLALTVTSDRPDQVEVPGLGLIAPVEEGAPARFDLLAGDPGRFAVRLVEADRRIGTLRVR